MPTFYNFRQDGINYSFDDVFVPADLFRSGNLWNWGENGNLQLGNNSTTDSFTPVTTFVGGTNWKQVSGGRYWTAAIKTDGTLWTWGNGSGGRLGTNDTINRSTPVTTFAGGTDWKQVSTNGITAAIKTDGTLWTWGDQWKGGLGRFERATEFLNPIVNTFNWADTATGDPEELYTICYSVNGRQSAAIKTDGTLWLWGKGQDGALGTNDTINISIPVTTFAGGTNWKQISLGTYHSAAIKTDGTLWTWGRGSSGQLGNADISNTSTPVTTFAGGTDWKQVSAGEDSTAAIKTDGTLWTWGDANLGFLGTNSTTDKSTPVTTFAGGTNWKQVSCGYVHTAAIKTDGTLWTWAFGGDGRLGNADIVNSLTPVTTFAGGTDWKQVSAGNVNTVSIKTDGTLWIWGQGNYGRMGNNTNNITNSTPITTFAGGTDWKQCSSGTFSNAAIKTDGTLWFWGNGTDGQFGTGESSIKLTPVTSLLGGTDWKQVSIGRNVVALKGDGTNNQVFNAGLGEYGQLGDGIVTVPRSIPGQVFGDTSNWKQVSTGLNHTAAIKTDGTLWTWGYNTSESLGINRTNKSITPVTTFVGGNDWKQASAAEYFSLAIKTDGTLWTWGNGNNGQLGRPVLLGQPLTPITTFAGGTNWADTATGKPEDLGAGRCSFAIKTDGTLWGWGSNSGSFRPGILGTNDLIDRSTPVTTFSGGTNWKQVDSGDGHTAAIKTDGTLWTWGRGDSGRLGTDDSSNRSTPVTTFAGGTDWKQLSIAHRGTHTVAIKTDGTLWTWGSNTSGELGINNSVFSVDTPVTTFSGGTDWKQSSNGNAHTAAIKTDGTLWVWGTTFNGRLGDANNNFSTRKSTPVTTFAGGTNWKQVSCGDTHTTAIKTDGTLWIWGSNAYGQLGNAETTDKSTPVTTFAGGTDWKQVSAGKDHTAAIKTDGTLWTWGSGSNGVLGNSSVLDRSTPVTTFIGGTNWKQVNAGYSHTLAINSEGILWSWGYNALAALGNNSITNVSTPITTFAGGTNWADTATGEPEELYTISIGYRKSAAIKTDGTLWTWGRASDGSLGINDVITRSTPVTTFAGGTNWKQLTCGYNNGAAIKTDGTLWTWGYGLSLGNNSITDRSTPITTFAGGTNWKQVSGTFLTMAAVKTDGTLWVWGNGGNGQLGTNDTIDRSTPVTTFAGGTDWKQINTSSNVTAAIKTDGTLWIWGKGQFGNLGTNDTINRSTPVTTFAGGTDWKQVSTNSITAAIKTDGTLWTWGLGYGELGTNDAIQRNTPVTTFAGGSNWKQVSNGYSHTAAIKTDGTLWVWGGNGDTGQLGTNDTTNRFTPVTTFAGGTNWRQVHCSYYNTIALKGDGINNELYIFGDETFSGNLGVGGWYDFGNFQPNTTFAGGTNWKKVSAGNRHTAAIKTDGTLWTWGNGLNGRLGNGVTTFTPISTPITTFAGGTNWKQVSAGNRHSAAIKTDGTLWTWGFGSQGRLGTNDTTSRSTPVTTFAGGTNWKEVSSGYEYAFAIEYNDMLINPPDLFRLFTWGYGSIGQLGNASANDSSTPVTTFAGGTNWKQISVNREHSAAIKTDGTLWTWGFGSNGKLGNGVTTFTTISTPITTFAGGTNWKQVSTGEFYTAAIKTDGTLWTWGSGSSSALGNASITNRSTPVTTFAGGTNWKQVSCGGYHVAAIKTDGTLWTWGSRDLGKLGTNDTSPNRSTPVTTFAGGTNWKEVDAGGEHTSAIKTDGTLWLWGYIPDISSGYNTTISTPVTTFAGGTNWKQVSCGEFYIAAIKTDGTLWSWGYGEHGQLGNNNTTSRLTPVTTFSGGTNWKQVSAGDEHTLAIKTDGTLWVWGYNGFLQLGTGDNNSTNKNTPVTTFAGGTNWEQIFAGGRCSGGITKN